MTWSSKGRTTTHWVAHFMLANRPERYETQRRDLGEGVWPYVEDMRVYTVTRTTVPFTYPQRHGG